MIAMALSPAAAAENVLFKPLSGAPKSAEEEFFKVTDGEAKITGHVIKQFVIKPEYLTVTYKNDGKKSLFPKYTVKVFNRYGYLLASDKVGVSIIGGSPKLEPGDVGGDKIRLELIDLQGVFAHTQLKLPDDFFTAAWLSISANNTKLAALKKSTNRN
ncbi:MAG: hypothetical protein KJO79_05985 [Verrucomicrobiae bacterium]|nr:hypothetical protein [Verrucomicrobiae bacterium]NNJ86712.1 hypothetical protein [Akkermansiaceae bacterium]